MCEICEFSIPVGFHHLHDFSMTFVILMTLKRLRIIESFSVSADRISIKYAPIDAAKREDKEEKTQKKKRKAGE